MTIDSFNESPVQQDQTGPATAEHALSNAARADTLAGLAAMAADASPAQQAEHIRSVVALNLAMLPTNTTPANQTQFANWQAWALGLADGLELAAAA